MSCASKCAPGCKCDGLNVLFDVFLRVSKPRPARYNSDGKKRPASYDSDDDSGSEDNREGSRDRRRRTATQPLASSVGQLICSQVVADESRLCYVFTSGGFELTVAFCPSTKQLTGAGCVGFADRELIMDIADRVNVARFVADRLQRATSAGCRPTASLDFELGGRFAVMRILAPGLDVSVRMVTAGQKSEVAP